MTPRHWNDAFSVGNPHLDSEHRLLLGLIHRLEEVGTAGLQEVLDGLIAYANEHFRHEEALMARGGFPGLEAHRGLHEAFRQEVQGFLTRSEQEPEVLLGPLRAFLEAWWEQHILREDAKYRPYLS